MGHILVKPMTRDEAEKVGISAWDHWECEPSEFEYHYDTTEHAYLFEGRVEVTCPDGEVVTFGAGDMVIFPAGLNCHWKVLSTVKKVYRFE